MKNPIRAALGALAAREAMRLQTRLMLTPPPVPGTISAAEYDLVVKIRDFWMGVVEAMNGGRK